MVQNYVFTLKYKLPENFDDLDAVIDQLYQNGCDDALIGSGLPGRLALEFDRLAASSKIALQTAHQDVLKTLPNAKLIEASPDFVGLTDIAEIVAVSRQQMRKIYEADLTFPSPLHAGKSAIWHLSEVLDWVKNNKKYRFCTKIHQISQAAYELNSTLR